ncbi:MAG TPA: hypothetical protein VFO10_08635 [Oligoflexus sp.]|uniref:hypothetical protein n=1 Tax=Oligoflexus sp. TaxID=1971216 RepID=UPI002D802125|nr:hypothetical protein [Oligoflexus sp.]HET9237304.1 hypothetical protein [Oligoflexus sp.]
MLCRLITSLMLSSSVLGATALALPASLDAPALFRSLYAEELKHLGMDESSIQRLHFPLTEEYANFLERCDQSAQDMRMCDQQAQSFKPSSLLQESLHTGFLPAPPEPAGPQPTFIIFPGYIAELAEITPYKDIFTADSRFKRAWRKTLARASHEERWARHYSVMDDSWVRSPLSEQIAAASLDDANGKVKLKLFAMTPLRGSLESVGSLADNADVMIERITQLDRISPLEGPVYILGYSRGTNVALEVVSRLPELKHTTRWASRIAGIVSLSAPIFGTPLADPQDPPAGFPVTTLARIGDRLQSCESGESPARRWSKVQNNARVWKDAIAEIIKDSQALSGPEELAWEGIKPEAIELKAALGILKGVLFDDLFRLSKPVAEYCENLRRFQLFVAKVFEGTEVMTTAQMENWFRTHTLPEDLDYISVNASMMDASRRNQVVFEGKNHLSYDVGSPDLQLSRTNFYQIVRSSGLEMNDGFVPVHRGRFFPGLHQRLNPLQKPYATRTVGVLWQHHLGVTIPAGIATADGGVSPFPRRAFLSALARFVQF